MSRPLVELLAWDSNFLGFPVGRLVASHLPARHLATLIDESRAAGTRLLYLVVDPANDALAAAARQAGARLADRKVTFARRTEPALLAVPTAGLGRGAMVEAPAFTPQLEQLAWQSGEFSRFRRDAQFAPHVFTAMYRQWLQASLTGELARMVLAWLSPAGAATGLLTLDERAGRASIGLLAVAPDARRQRIGQQLVEAARAQAQRWGCSRLHVVTQRDNTLACDFYAACGFELVREEHIYHLWL